MCAIPDQFLGGIANCGHPGSAGILLAFRWLIQRKVAELNLAREYDYMILSRADELYLCDHSALIPLDRPEDIYLPVGEYWNGYSDRHLFGTTQTFLRAINITTELVCRPEYWFGVFSDESVWFNLETTQRVMWWRMGLQVAEFNRSMLTVKKSDDPFRWSPGWQDNEAAPFGLNLKYPRELHNERYGAAKFCNTTLTEQLTRLATLNYETHGP